MEDKVLLIEKDCLTLIEKMDERLKQAKKDFEEWDNTDDMQLIDEMKTAIEYMQDMLKTIRNYK